MLLEQIKKRKPIQTECDAACGGGAAVCASSAGGCTGCGPANVAAAVNVPNQTPPMTTVPPCPKPTYKAGIHTRNVGPGAYVPFVVPGAIFRRNRKKKRKKSKR